MARIKSVKGLFGQTIHYKNGERVGETRDGFIPGTKNHYDACGQYVGYSTKGFLADEVHFDAHSNRIGSSWKDASGSIHHYDNCGKSGVSYEGLTGITSIIDDHARSMFTPSSDDNDFGATDPFADPDW